MKHFLKQAKGKISNYYENLPQSSNIVEELNSSTIPSLENSSNLLDTFKAKLPPLIKHGIGNTVDIIPLITMEMTRLDIESFADHALLLMSAAISEKKYSSIYDYDAVQEACKKMFGEECLHSRFQAKLHAALLLNFSNEDDRLQVIHSFRAYLDKNQNSLKVPPAVLADLKHSISSLCMVDTRKKHEMRSNFYEEFEIVCLEYSILQKKEELFFKREKEQDYLISENKEKKTKNPMSRAFYTNTVPDAAHSLLNKTQKGKNLSLSLLNSVKEQLFTSTNESLSKSNFLDGALPKEAELQDMENFSLALRDTELLDKIQTFRNLFVPQDFRIVVLGEGKRGKSTLINALLGKEILPTRTILPETSTVLELAYSKEPFFEIEWLDEYEFENLEKTLIDDSENMLLQEKVNSFRHILENKEILENLRSIKVTHIDELREYSSPDGLYSSLVKKIRIGLNEESLPKGILLVDTPATNSTDPFMHYLTKEECLKADCLILLLDSRQPDSFSELQFIKSIVKEGRAVKIIGVLTHPLHEEVENTIAKERANKILQEAIREVPEITLLNIFSFNPKETVEHFEKHKNMLTSLFNQKLDKEYLQFIEILTDTIKLHAKNELSSERMKSTYSHLCSTVATRKEELLANYSKSLPTNQHIHLLEEHAQNLNKATQSYAEHARSLIINAISEVEEWHRQTLKAIDSLEERIILNLSNEMRIHAERLGNKFAKESEWKEFDELISGLITQELVEDFKKEQSEHLATWEEKIRIFNNEAEKLSLESLEKLQKSADELSVLCSSSSKFDNLLVQTNSYMRKITLLLSGAGIGMLANTGIINLLALGTAGLAFVTNPIVIPSAFILGIGAFALNKFSNPTKLKEAFLQRKEEKVRLFTKKLKQELYEQAAEIQEELLFAYSSSIHKSLAPTLEIMASEAVNMNLYIQTIKTQNINLNIELCTTQDPQEITEEI